MTDPTLIIDAEPDWKEPPEVAYSFATAIQGTPAFLEQRRPLLSTPTRSVACKFVLETENAQRLLNILLSGAPQLCCTPIYSEPIFAGTITQGASAITAETDLTYLWNIQNCDYLILLDYVTGASEMLQVSSVSGQVINLSAAIVGSWTAAQTVIYPGIASMIKEVKKLDHSSRIASFGAQFEEITVGEEATKVWVGLDEQICIGFTVNQVFISGVESNGIVELRYNPIAHTTFGVSIDLDNIAGWTLPRGSELLSAHPWSGIYSGRNDYLLCDRRYGQHKFWILDGFTETVRSTFTVPGVTQAGYETNSTITAFGIHPTTGKFYVCAGAYVGGTYTWYKRYLRYSSPGGTLEYDSGNVVAYGGEVLSSANILFAGNKIYDHYSTTGYGYSSSNGLREMDEDFADVSGGIKSKFINFFKEDGSYFNVWVDSCILSFDGWKMWLYSFSSFSPLATYALVSIDPTSFYTIADAYNTIGVPYGSWELEMNGHNPVYFPRQWGNVGYSRF